MLLHRRLDGRSQTVNGQQRPAGQFQVVADGLDIEPSFHHGSAGQAEAECPGSG